MPIVATCSCGKRYQVKDELAGKQVRCPACSQSFLVPSPAPAGLTPLANDPFANDPFSAGSANPFGVPATPAWTTPASGGFGATPGFGASSFGQPAKKAGPSKGLIIGLVVGGVALFGMLVIVVLIALLLPAVQAARNAARQAAARNAARQNSAVAAPATPVPGAVPGATATSDGWVTYAPSGGRFSIVLPRQPIPRTQSVPTIAGMITIYSAEVPDADGSFTVMYNDYPVVGQQVDANRVLDACCQGAATTTSGRILSTQPISLGGHPGREIVLEGTMLGRPISLHGKIYLAGNRLYQTLWAGPRNTEPVAKTQRFFGSFTITENPPATASTTPPQSSPIMTPPPISPTPPIPGGTPPPGSASGGLSENQKRFLFRFVSASQQNIDRMQQSLDAAKSRPNSNASFLEQQLQIMRTSHATTRDNLCRQHNITQPQLDEIVAEGKRNNW